MKSSAAGHIDENMCQQSLRNSIAGGDEVSTESCYEGSLGMYQLTNNSEMLSGTEIFEKYPDTPIPLKETKL